MKFWVDVSQDKQLPASRRVRTTLTRHGSSPTRTGAIAKYPQYCVAINDMLRMTSTYFAPWNIIEV